MTLVKAAKQTLFSVIVVGRTQPQCSLQQKREIGVNAEYNQEKWEFIAREQSRGVGGQKFPKRLGWFLLRWPNRILAEGSQGDQPSPGGTEEAEEVTRCEGGGVSLNWPDRVLAETGLLRPNLQGAWRGLSSVWSGRESLSLWAVPSWTWDQGYLATPLLLSIHSSRPHVSCLKMMWLDTYSCITYSYI